MGKFSTHLLIMFNHRCLDSKIVYHCRHCVLLRRMILFTTLVELAASKAPPQKEVNSLLQEKICLNITAVSNCTLFDTQPYKPVQLLHDLKDFS